MSVSLSEASRHPGLEGLASGVGSSVSPLCHISSASPERSSGEE